MTGLKFASSLLLSAAAGIAAAQVIPTDLEPLLCRRTGCEMAVTYATPTATVSDLAFAFEAAGWEVSGRTDSAFVVTRELPPALRAYGYRARDMNRFADSGPVIPRATVRWRPDRYRVDLLGLVQYNSGGLHTFAVIVDVPETDDLKSRYTQPVAAYMARGGFGVRDVTWGKYLSEYLADAFGVEAPPGGSDW